MRTLTLILTLVMSLSACADGDTTSTTTEDPAAAEGAATGGADDPAAGTQPAGTPIPVEGEGDIGDGSGAPTPLAEAPDFGISSDTDSGSFPWYTSCWSVPTEDGSLDTCSDGVPQPHTLDGGDRLVVTYEEGELTAFANAAGSPGDVPEAAGATVDLPVVQENPGIWIVDTTGLGDGDHDVFLSWRGGQGDATAALTLSVRR